uniref:Uncharacterized protein n=1 Tax=Aplanochytrium stocchinoi TaxID=215587 RepID=A0A7S3LKQ3_9STRA
MESSRTRCGEKMSSFHKCVDLSHLDQLETNSQSKKSLSQTKMYTIEREKSGDIHNSSFYSGSRNSKVKSNKAYKGTFTRNQVSATPRPLSAPLRKPRPIIPVRANRGTRK